MKVTMNTFRICAGLLLGALASPQAFADVRYDFTAHSSIPVAGTSYSYTGSFSVVLADFVTGFAEVLPAAMLSCHSQPSPVVNGCVSAQFNSVSLSNDAMTFSVRSVEPNTVSVGLAYYFADGAFATPGVHASQILGPRQAATLVVTSIPAVPEPASAALLIPGLMALVAISRRSKSAARRVSLAG